MASVLVLCLCSTQTLILILLLHSLLVGVKAQMGPLYYSCSLINNYTEGSKFQSNLNRLLYRSLFNKGENSRYAKDSVGEKPDKVFGVVLCRGDVAPKDCQNCIDAASEILNECPGSKQSTIWYDHCLVRYSNVSLVSILDLSRYRIYYNTQTVSRPKQFLGNLSAMFDNLTNQATTVDSTQKYAANSMQITEFQELYGMVQCLPDLSAADCRACLNTAFDVGVRNISLLNDGKVSRGGRVLLDSCNVRYEIYHFFSDSVRGLEAPPPSSTSQGNKYEGEEEEEVFTSSSA